MSSILYQKLPTKEHFCNEILRPDLAKELESYALIAAMKHAVGRMDPLITSVWVKDGKFYSVCGIDTQRSFPDGMVFHSMYRPLALAEVSVMEAKEIYDTCLIHRDNFSLMHPNPQVIWDGVVEIVAAATQSASEKLIKDATVSSKPYCEFPTREQLCHEILRPDQAEELESYVLIAVRMYNLSHTNPWITSVWVKGLKFYSGTGMDTGTSIQDNWTLDEVSEKEAKRIFDRCLVHPSPQAIWGAINIINAPVEKMFRIRVYADVGYLKDLFSAQSRELLPIKEARNLVKKIKACRNIYKALDVLGREIEVVCNYDMFDGHDCDITKVKCV